MQQPFLRWADSLLVLSVPDRHRAAGPVRSRAALWDAGSWVGRGWRLALDQLVIVSIVAVNLVATSPGRGSERPFAGGGVQRIRVQTENPQHRILGRGAAGEGPEESVQRADAKPGFEEVDQPGGFVVDRKI